MTVKVTRPPINLREKLNEIDKISLENFKAMDATFSGNVGIGATSPAGKLDVSVASNQRIRLDDFGGTSRISSRNNSAAILPLLIDASDLILNSGSGGNVGIGTSEPLTARLNLVTAATAGISNAFDIRNPQNAVGTGDGAMLRIHSTTDANRGVAIASSSETNYATDNSMLFYTSASSTLTERMRIDSIGKVGIGAPTPSGNLHVIATVDNGPAATLYLQSHDTIDASAYIRFVGRNNSNVAMYSTIHTGPAGNSAAAPIIFSRGNGEADESMRIDSNGNVGIGTSSPNGNGILTLNTPADNSAQIVFAENDTAKWLIGHRHDGDYFRFYDLANSAERMRIDASGDTFFGISSKADVPTNGGVYIAGDNSVGSSNSYAQVFVVHNSSTNHGIIIKELNASGEAIQFLNSSATIVGSISTGASATAYNTSSDYRLKENVVAMSGATERLKQLKPSRFNFIADADTTVDGFLAHEVQDIVPEAITGTKDAMRDEEYEVTPAVLDDDGNVITEAVMGTRSVPDYQGIDQSKLVPLLVATIQELEARIAALES